MRVGVVALALLALLAGPASAQSDGKPVTPPDPTPTLELARPASAVAPVPFGPGERLVYDVRVGLFGDVGDGYMQVDGPTDVRGRETYHLTLGLKAGVLFFHVRDKFQSWMDVGSLSALRFQQDQKEIRYERHRTFDFYPAERRWRRPDNDEEGDLPTDHPLDDVSFLYYVRTLPLEVGQTDTLPNYFQESGNPVIIKVLRRETVKVPAGTFNTIVVRPIIKTSGLFGDGGEAEVYFTDDERRLLVMMKSHMPILKSLDLKLKSITLGVRLSPLTFE